MVDCWQHFLLDDSTIGRTMQNGVKDRKMVIKNAM